MQASSATTIHFRLPQPYSQWTAFRSLRSGWKFNWSDRKTTVNHIRPAALVACCIACPALLGVLRLGGHLLGVVWGVKLLGGTTLPGQPPGRGVRHLGGRLPPELFTATAPSHLPVASCILYILRHCHPRHPVIYPHLYLHKTLFTFIRRTLSYSCNNILYFCFIHTTVTLPSSIWPVAVCAYRTRVVGTLLFF